MLASTISVDADDMVNAFLQVLAVLLEEPVYVERFAASILKDFGRQFVSPRPPPINGKNQHHPTHETPVDN